LRNEFKEKHDKKGSNSDYSHTKNPSGLPNNFIRDYVTYIAKKLPSDRIALEAQAFFLLSMALGLTVKIPGRMGDIKFNLLFLNRGVSRLGFKSLPLNSFTRPVLRKLSKIVDKKLMMPKDYTKEAVIGYFSGEKSVGKGKNKKTVRWKNDEGGIIYDEFSSIFKENAKSYQGQMLELISEMYTGWIDGRITKTHGFEGDLNVFVSMFAATTDEFLLGITSSFFRQGTGNRFLYMETQPIPLPKPLDKKGKPIPLFGRKAVENNENYDEANDEFAERLAIIRKKCPKTIDLTGNASKLMDQYYHDNHNFGINEYQSDRESLMFSYYSERSILALKLAGLYAVSENEIAIAEGDYDSHDLFINEKAVKWAIKRMEGYTRNFEDVLNRWPQVQASGQAVKTSEKDFKLVKSILKEHGGNEGLTKHQLRKLTNFSDFKFKEVIKSMELRGDLEKYVPVKIEGSKGRPGQRIRRTDEI